MRKERRGNIDKEMCFRIRMKKIMNKELILSSVHSVLSRDDEWKCTGGYKNVVPLLFTDSTQEYVAGGGSQDDESLQ